MLENILRLLGRVARRGQRWERAVIERVSEGGNGVRGGTGLERIAASD